MTKKQTGSGESKIVKKALDFASKIHEGVVRKSGQPYITHPIAVKDILKDHGFSDKVLCAALLHDVLEDSDDYAQTEKDLFEIFGDEVFFLVEAVSKDTRMKNKKQRDEKYYRQITLAMQQDPAVIFLKAADLLHNVSTLKYLSKERQDRWINELKDFYMLNFTKNFHVVPAFHRDFFHQLVFKLQEVIDRHENPKK